MVDKRQLLGMTLEELKGVASEVSLPAYAAKQMADWIYKKKITRISEMTNIAVAKRALLEDSFEIGAYPPSEYQKSKDGTIKYLYAAGPGRFVESVYIPTDDRATLCVSSQVGCKMNCLFCMTGKQGFTANLTANQILNQIQSLPENDSLTNIVFMGMGEPLLNYEQVLRAIERITAQDGLAMSPYRITVSTAGIPEKIRQLADDGVRFNLALSLHAAKETTRTFLMPVNKAYPLSEIAGSLKYFVEKTGTRPTFEYLLLKDINDSLEDAKALALYCRQFPIKINIIEYNNVEGSGFQHSPDKNRDAFIRFLEGCNMVVNVRRSKGKDIDAACGQLAGKQESNL